MKIKLERDEARTIEQNFFPYWFAICDTNCRSAKPLTPEHLFALIVRSIARDIKHAISKKLYGFAQNFTFDFEEHEIVVLYQLLKAIPIEAKEVWMRMIRDKLLAKLDQYFQMLSAIEGQFIQ